jgi:hypothetical protein
MRYTIDTLTSADDELLVEILEALSKRHGIRFVANAEAAVAFDQLPVAATTADEWAQRLQEAEASGTVSWESAQARFGL